MRNAILFLHRWVALITGAVLVVVSVTGAFIVYEGPIDRALNPGLFRVAVPAPAPAPLPLDTLAARAAVRGRLSSLLLPERPGLAAVATIAHGVEVFLDPYTGAVIGTRTPEQRDAGFNHLMRALHVQLLAGKAGNQVVMWTTIGSLFLVLGGLYLWWQDKRWTVRLRASWKRINFDLHHALGLYAFLVLLLMSATGVVMHYAVLGRAIGKLDRTRPADPVPQSTAPAGTPAASLDAAARAALAALDGSVLRSISTPGDDRRPYTVALRFPEDHTPTGRSRVSIDRFTGAVLSVRSSRVAGLGTRLNSLQRPLHTGDIFGAPSRLVWFVGCWVMAAQVLSGALMWWHGRSARQAAAARQRNAAV